PGEKVLGLIDCTTFGSASDCVLFSSNALYYHNGLGGAKPNPALVPYSDFPGCNFAKYWLFCVSVKDDWYMNLAGSNVNRGKVVETLNAIKHAVLLLRDAPAQDVTPSARRRSRSQLPERVLEILQRYAGQSGFYVSPKIPPKKLSNATAKAEVPDD